MRAPRRVPRPRRPPPVVPGDVVGVAALSSAVAPDALSAGMRELERLGFETRPASNLLFEWNGFAGRDEERVAGLHELVAAPEVKAIVFARGGHGLLRVLPSIDWSLLAASPKAYVGYSDLAPLLLLIATRLGLVTFHGPMVATDLSSPLDAAERASFLDALAGRLGRSLPCAPAQAAPAVEGRLLGGCLAMLVSTLGTPWFPRLEGSLLFLEDVHEPLYRIDRMLTQLELSGRVARVKGMILGHLGDETEDRADASGGGRAAGLTSGEAAWKRLSERPSGGEARILAWDLPCGHGRPNLTLPLGVRARLDSEAGALVVLDDGLESRR